MTTNTRKVLNEAEFNRWVTSRFGTAAGSTFKVTDRWIAHGDGVAIYEDGDFTRLEAGAEPSEKRGPVVAVYFGKNAKDSPA